MGLRQRVAREKRARAEDADGDDCLLHVLRYITDKMGTRSGQAGPGPNRTPSSAVRNGIATAALLRPRDDLSSVIASARRESIPMRS
jgi:hypothetical protein